VITLSNPNAKFGVNQSDTVTQGIDFSGSAISGDGIFTQAGSGTTTLNAANSYAGATLVNAGKLLINGNQSAATGAVTVAAGATLGGSGTTGGAVTVNGILSPGNSPGVLTVASVALNASSTSLFEVNGTTRGTQYDGLDITGVNGVTYDGALSLSFGNGSSFADNTTFDLFSFTGTPSGNFSSVTSTGYYAGTWTQAAGEWSLTTSEQKLTFTPSTGDLVIAVPEPATLGLLSGLAVVGFFARRQRGARG
jgi:autotransporter-associated beta strand protein